MAGANYMGGKRSSAKRRTKDTISRTQKIFFNKQKLDQLSKGSKLTLKSFGEPQPSKLAKTLNNLDLAHARKALSDYEPDEDDRLYTYIPAPTIPSAGTSTVSSGSNQSARLLEAVDTGIPSSLRTTLDRIIAMPNLAGIPSGLVQRSKRQRDNVESHYDLQRPTKRDKIASSSVRLSSEDPLGEGLTPINRSPCSPTLSSILNFSDDFQYQDSRIAMESSPVHNLALSSCEGILPSFPQRPMFPPTTSYSTTISRDQRKSLESHLSSIAYLSSPPTFNRTLFSNDQTRYLPSEDNGSPWVKVPKYPSFEMVSTPPEQRTPERKSLPIRGNPNPGPSTDPKYIYSIFECEDPFAAACVILGLEQTEPILHNSSRSSSVLGAEAYPAHSSNPIPSRDDQIDPLLLMEERHSSVSPVLPLGKYLSFSPQTDHNCPPETHSRVSTLYSSSFGPLSDPLTRPGSPVLVHENTYIHDSPSPGRIAGTHSSRTLDIASPRSPRTSLFDHFQDEREKTSEQPIPSLGTQITEPEQNSTTILDILSAAPMPNSPEIIVSEAHSPLTVSSPYRPATQYIKPSSPQMIITQAEKTVDEPQFINAPSLDTAASRASTTPIPPFPNASRKTFALFDDEDLEYESD